MHAPGVCDSIYGMSFRNVSMARPKLIWNSARSFAICCMTGGKFVPIVLEGNVVKVDSSSLWKGGDKPADATTPLGSFVIWNASIVDVITTMNETINLVTEWFIDIMLIMTYRISLQQWARVNECWQSDGLKKNICILVSCLIVNQTSECIFPVSSSDAFSSTRFDDAIFSREII